MKRLIIAAAAVLVAAPAAAIFIRAGEPVPLERLFRNVSDHVRRTPKDPQAHYTLGRLHSLAFVKSATAVHVISAPGKLPAFPPYESVKVQPDQSKRTDAALKHLAASIRSYTTATRLDPSVSNAASIAATVCRPAFSIRTIEGSPTSSMVRRSASRICCVFNTRIGL